MDKRQRERSVFRQVFGRVGRVARQGDEPDFVLSLGEHRLGVEVTEHFLTQSNARLHYVPNYFRGLMGGTRPLHRDDIETIPVVGMELYDADGTPKGPIRGILQKGVTLEESVKRLVKVIQRKEAAVDRYLQRCHAVSLIVNDHTIPMSTLEVEQYHTALIPLFGLEETLLATKFHEIYLLTGFKDRPEVYIPLKMALATERLFRFQHILFDDTSLPPFTDPKIIEWREGLTTYTQLHGLCGLFLHLNLEQPVSCLRSAPHIRLPYVGFSLRSRSHSIFDGRFPLFIGARRPPNPRSAWILSSSDWLRRQEAATGATSFRTGLVLDREK